MGKESPGIGRDRRCAAATSHEENLVVCNDAAVSHEK